MAKMWQGNLTEMWTVHVDGAREKDDVVVDAVQVADR